MQFKTFYTNITQGLLITFSIASFIITPANAANQPINPGAPAIPSPGNGNTDTGSSSLTVTPTSASDSSSNPIFGINLTTCLSTFDWATYMSDLRAGRTNTNPYILKDCVRQDNVVTNGTRIITKDSANKITGVTYNIGSPTVNTNKYSNFQVGSSTTKQDLGQAPVLGIFDNGGFKAQALSTYEPTGTQVTAGQSVNRSVKEGLSTIFTSSQLSEIYSTGGERTGLPRIPYAGGPTKENFSNVNGQLIWNGGYCKVANGKFSVRTKWEGTGPDGTQLSYNINPQSDLGINPNTPLTSCSWPETSSTTAAGLIDQGLVKDSNLEVYQFIYEIPYPENKTECDTWFPNSFTTYESCLSWFQERYSKALTGNSGGKRIFYTYTYYGAWNDIYSKWVGWVNPDIGGPRDTFTSNATLDELRDFFDDPESTLRQVLADQTSTYSQLVGKMNSAPAATKESYRQALKTSYEAWIRGGDGYSIYVLD